MLGANTFPLYNQPSYPESLPHLCIAFSFGLCTCFLGYCNFFPFPPLETIKSLVRTKEKSFFLSTRAQRRHQVSHPEKRIRFFPATEKWRLHWGQNFLLFPKKGLFLFILFLFILVTCVVPWFCYLCDSVTSDTLWTNPNPD